MADNRQKPQRELSSPESVSARSKVFGITELLETVLTHLPARDLLMCECINKTWHAVIKKSNTLQEKLFYRCHPVTLSKDMDKLDLEINPFFLLVQRRWSCVTKKEKGANGFEDLDYPEASWKNMYLSRPAVCKMGITRKSPESSASDLLVQVIQHDNIKMNHLRNSNTKYPNRPTVIRLSQSDGIRMHHLLGMDLSEVIFVTLTGDQFMRLNNFSSGKTRGCPEPSLRQFYDMYVSHRECQRSSDDVPPDLLLPARYW